MQRFTATCQECDWEGPATQTAEQSAINGIAHLTAHHAVVLQSGDVSFIRVWEFQQLQPAVSVPPGGWLGEPKPADPPHHAAAAHHEHEEPKGSKEPAKGR
jgi:hypothetical protein